MTYIHEPGYTGRVSLKRLYSHWIWGRNVSKYLKSLERPDVVYCAIPSMTVGVKAAKYCKKQSVKFVVDIQDLWPEAFQLAVKNKLLRSLFLPLHWYVNRAYRAADKVIAVSDTYRNRGLKVNRKDKEGLTVFLGNNGDFDGARENFIQKRPDGELWIAYIGGLSYSYDIKCAIEAIDICQERIGNQVVLKFIIMGAGPLKGEFEKYASDLHINCDFTGSLPYEEMVGRLCSCDIVVNPIVKGGMQSITNKVGDYALSGLPVVNTCENVEYRELIELYQCGINCEVGDSRAVADAFEKLVLHPDMRKKMGNNARKLGIERFDRKNSYCKIYECLEALERIV